MILSNASLSAGVSTFGLRNNDIECVVFDNSLSFSTLRLLPSFLKSFCFLSFFLGAIAYFFLFVVVAAVVAVESALFLFLILYLFAPVNYCVVLLHFVPPVLVHRL